MLKVGESSQHNTLSRNSCKTNKILKSVSGTSPKDLNSSISAELSSNIASSQSCQSRLGNVFSFLDTPDRQRVPRTSPEGSDSEDSLSNRGQRVVGNTSLQTSMMSEKALQELATTKKQLKMKLTERGEVLRKLNMVRTYRTKNDLHHLQCLINKWRCACQQAVLDLHQLTPDPRPSLTQLVQQLGIDKELVCYDDVEECFDAP